ncbi:MAG: glutamine synthetase type III, partial [Clostridia bacterium]|nr:glutamine synthetase type III [Clostridia bacterium]
AVAESLKIFADRLERANDFEGELHDMIRQTIRDHKRIIFNGNGYDDAWIREATEERGLLNFRTTADCMPHLLDRKNVDMLTSHRVFTVDELRSRRDIMLENYCKTVTIEANTMADMAKTLIAPAVSEFASHIASCAQAKKALDPSVVCAYETDLVRRLSALTDRISSGVSGLQEALLTLQDAKDVIAESELVRDNVLPKMCELRVACDEAETVTAKDYWPMPTYADILFSVR